MNRNESSLKLSYFWLKKRRRGRIVNHFEVPSTTTFFLHMGTLERRRHLLISRKFMQMDIRNEWGFLCVFKGFKRKSAVCAKDLAECRTDGRRDLDGMGCITDPVMEKV